MKNRIILFSALTILWLLGSTLFALDLKFTSAIRMTPATPATGDTITFTVSFTPQGGAVTNFKIIGGIDTTQVYERTFASIAADATRTVSFTWTSTAGNHTVWFVLDPDRLSRDADYANNRVELPFSGGVLFEAHQPALSTIMGIKPDLTVTRLKLTRDSSRDDKYFYEVKFKNQGGGCVGAFNFRMYGRSTALGEDLCATCPKGRIAAVRPLCALKAGEEKTINGFILRSDFSRSTLHNCLYENWVTVIVDHDEKVDESNEFNNGGFFNSLYWEREENCP